MLTVLRADTIQDILNKAKEDMRLAGIISYNREAGILFCHVAGIGLSELYMPDFDISQQHKTQFEKLVNERIRGIPLQYVTGQTEFFGLLFYVEQGVFIPRPETEILVQAVLDKLPKTAPCNILDLCTGSGNIAISLAKFAKYAKITAIDKNQNCLNIAERNALFNKANNIKFIKSNLFENLDSDEKFDIIVSNPPYIKKSDLEILPPEVKHEPALALDGGQDGLDFYRRILQESPKFLKQGGFLALELGDDQVFVVKNMFSGPTEIIKDLNGIERVLIWTKS